MPDIPQIVAAIDTRLADIAVEIGALDAARAELSAPRTAAKRSPSPTTRMAATGMRNDQIAAQLRCRREVVSQWRKRFFEQRLVGLEDRPRRGRPPAFPPSGPG
jgi:hypothetical protein